MPGAPQRKNYKSFLAVVALAGLVMIALGLHVVYHQYQVMTQWPRADALVISSRLDHGLTTGNSNAYIVTVYWPAVTLQYTVGGKQYVVPAAYAAKSSIRSNWQPVVDDLRPGVHRRLPYDPDNPSHIYVGVKWNFANLALAGFLILIGGVLILMALMGTITRTVTVKQA